MKFTDLPSVYRALAVLDVPYRLLVIEAGDDFFREDCVERYIGFWKKKVPDGEVKRSSAAELMSHREWLQEDPSLFGTKTLYSIEELHGVKGKKGLELASLLQGAHDDAYFLLHDSESMPKDLLADAEAHGTAFVIPAMKSWDRQPFLVSWILAFVKKRGKGIDADAASILAQSYPSDRGGLIQELEKLCMYCLNEPAIVMQDVEEIGTIDLQPTMWQLLDGLLAGDSKAVAHCLVQSREMHDIAMLRFVKNQLERLLVALEGGAPPRNKPQERQMAVVRKRGSATIVSWINRLKMQEVAIRSGLEISEEGSLLPFFLSMCAR
jgi:DNA polymerase III delta subunit